MPGFQRVAAASEFTDSLVRVFVVDGIDVAVVRHAGRFYAVTGACPHANYLFNYTRIRPEDRIRWAPARVINKKPKPRIARPVNVMVRTPLG